MGVALKKIKKKKKFVFTVSRIAGLNLCSLGVWGGEVWSMDSCLEETWSLLHGSRIVLRERYHSYEVRVGNVWERPVWFFFLHFFSFFLQWSYIKCCSLFSDVGGIWNGWPRELQAVGWSKYPLGIPKSPWRGKVRDWPFCSHMRGWILELCGH